jgi:hypothetical protein
MDTVDGFPHQFITDLKQLEDIPVSCFPIMQILILVVFDREVPTWEEGRKWIQNYGRALCEPMSAADLRKVKQSYE